jgi:hypothetical protein
MVNRRRVLQGGIAVTSLPFVANVAWGAALQPPLAFYKIIFDERFEASRRFGAEAQRRGAPVHAIQGDITPLWYDDLHARWSKSAVPIAGLTAHGALFCLERLAWDVGMRVAYRADHKPTIDGPIQHSAQGPAEMLRAASGLRDAQDWSCYAASIVLGCPAIVPGKKKRAVFADMNTAMDEEGQALISWVIAPRGRTA